jgi:FKBP-type peptidyl-prolyl cis-trans isomerase 2
VAIEIGTGKLIKGLDKEILGMTEGEEKKVDVSPEEGYGAEDPNLVINIPYETFKKNNLEPHVGMVLKTSKGNGYVTQMVDKDVEVNFNHPLAGKNLTFDISIVEIVKG